REGGIHQRLAEFGLRGIGAIEVDRVGVLRQQREPAVVDRQHRPSERMLIDVADLEIFVDAPCPTFFDSHGSPREPERSAPLTRYRERANPRPSPTRYRAHRGPRRYAHQLTEWRPS